MNSVIIGNVLGGVDYTIPPGEHPIIGSHLLHMADASNIVPTKNGYATKRNGSRIINYTAAYGTNITSFHEYFNSSGTAKHFCAESTKIGLLSGSSFGDHKTGLTGDGAYGQWLNYGGYAIYANGVDDPLKTDGTTMDALTADESGLTGAKWLAEWGERVWTTDNTARLIGSALRAPTDFSTATKDIGYWEGYIGDKNKAITALVPYLDMLLIGKQNQLYALVGSPVTASSTFSLVPIQSRDLDAIGFTCGNAAAVVDNDLIFLDGFAIKRLTGITEYGDVGSSETLLNIQDYFRYTIDEEYLTQTCFFHYKYKNQIWCTIPTGEETRLWIVIDYSNPSLRQAIGLPKYSFFPMSGITPLFISGVVDDNIVVPYMTSSDGYVRQMDYGLVDYTSETGYDAVTAYATWAVGYPDAYVQPVSVNLNVWNNNLWPEATTLKLYYAMGYQDWQDVQHGGLFTALGTETLTDSSWRTVRYVSQKLISSFYQNTGRTFLLKILNDQDGLTRSPELRQSVLKYRKRFKYYG